MTLAIGFVLGGALAAAVARMLASAQGRAAGEQRRLLEEARGQLADTFKAVAAQALRTNNEEFRERAMEGVMRPVQDSLAKVDNQIRAMEKERGQAWGSLTEQVRSLMAAQEKLRSETGNLVKALRAPVVRGRWGEIQLKRVVEMAGMLEHCDFDQQATLSTEEGRLRPDLVVRLPGGRNVVVDVKAPLQAYLDALEAPTDEERLARLRDHAAAVRSHILKLAAKAYWDQMESTPEFVVLFLPGEMFYSAALEQMPSLIEEGVARRVILATPTTLIALLQAVHYGWRQERVAENAQLISDHGRALHERVATLVEHFNKLGTSLGRSMEHFNLAMASFEGRVLPAARKLDELGAGGKKGLADLVRTEGRPRIVARVDRGGGDGDMDSAPKLDA